MRKKLKIKGSQQWTLDMINEMYYQADKINNKKYKLDIYNNQIEIITAERMIDASTSAGLPIQYTHWSHGEDFLELWNSYKRGNSGLAYELVINTNPAISYLMEENTMCCQTLVTTHAGFGHNSFFKTNYLMKQWTDAGSILDYLEFGKNYIRACEDRYGIDAVEETLDAAHSLKWYGMDRYKRPSKKTKDQLNEERIYRLKYEQSKIDDLMSSVPNTKIKEANPDFEEGLIQLPEEPEENILYFIEKHSPKLETWQREIIRIVRKISQYFYPNIQTNVTNEGFATYWHYKFMHDFHDAGFLDVGAMMEFYKLHTGVVAQHDEQRMNPYALGFSIYKDIERVAMNPTPEDHEWFHGQDWVGQGDWIAAVKYAAANFKNDSFIQQYLSPKVIRDLGLFLFHSDENKEYYEVTAIQDERGYRKLTESLANSYNLSNMFPDIQVINVDVWGDRTLTLQHNMINDRRLNPDMAIQTLDHLKYLWKYDVELASINSNDEVVQLFPEEQKEGAISLIDSDLFGGS